MALGCAASFASTVDICRLEVDLAKDKHSLAMLTGMLTGTHAGDSLCRVCMGAFLLLALKLVFHMPGVPTEITASWLAQPGCTARPGCLGRALFHAMSFPHLLGSFNCSPLGSVCLMLRQTVEHIATYKHDSRNCCFDEWTDGPLLG